ncbi:ABC transporter ATP-binding protein (plasmid) [Streptobacillus moniliformis]|uniref:ABC transporter related protein n=1 Tax=Streptobacillus moniliformis (strain ATCC 14647 / DSM 12112 / NCTC 10651 / 9901) TaxID=519441 RepID=D1AYW4_STRM9|nr:ATP-binding cassette domain-containing protein [Streptobacillus moniliformis]ACZ01938.1 ABC transporter related protein [Streptobacillus moniliformis DSM 12112]AVL42352.1 ABC transporter ATP-binding protein [Streptobacillus moniliformis]SQA14936.1 Energy-coupling factor transporter ATP-binding protein EcfA [Streptobacillus moniliformis]
MEKIISINNLNKVYKIKKGFFSRSEIKTIQALKNINLEIYKGQTVGLIGLNGAGKSTLIKIILGILVPTEGEIKVFDKEPFENRIENLYNIGVIFGQKTQLRWDLSPLDSYKLNKALYDIPGEKFETLLNKYSEILELNSFIDRPVRTLSLGQKMRADLLSALLHSPELLILDEATIGVDILSKNKILKLIEELKKDTTIIYTSHNLNEVYEISDRIIILNKGEIVLDKNKDDILNDIEYLSIKIYLKSPLKYDSLKFREVKISKTNEYEYNFEFIRKDELKNFLDYIYLNNLIDYFEIKENNLEKILKEVSNG